MHAFILAGGFATRLWPLTEHRAKPLLPLAGVPLISQIVEKIPADIHVTVSTNAVFLQSFEEWRKEMRRDNLTVIAEPATHDDRKLGTNGAIALWIKEHRITDDVLLLTGDNYLGFSIHDFLRSYTGHTLLAAFDVGSLDEATKFGTVLLAEDGSSVSGFEEKPAHPKTTLASTGCSIIPASMLGIVTEYAVDHPDHIGGIFEEFLRRGVKVECFHFTEPWFDIGSFETYVSATKALVGDRTLMPTDATVVSTQTNGSNVVGRRSHIVHSSLTDSVIFDDCQISDCVLDRCVIDNCCNLKGVDLTGKMIRAGTTLRKA